MWGTIIMKKGTYKKSSENEEMFHNGIKNLIQKISSEMHITTEFVDDAPGKYVDFFALDSSWIVGNDIVIGKYTNDENMLISFFHELGHCLISREYIDKWEYNTLMIELECWNIGIEEARKRKILFSDSAIKFGFEKALTYSGHDERECMNWKETHGKKLIKSCLTTTLI